MTQSGGQAAGIQLQVGLDLAFFRNQLPKLGAAAAGYPLTFKVEFDRRSIQNELNALGTNIKKRNYFLEVKTNLAAEIELAKKLTTALDNLGRSQQAARAGVGQRLGVGAIGRAPLQGGLGSKDVEKLYRASARAGLLVFDKEIAKTKVSMVAAMDAIGVDAIAGLLNGLSSQDARLRAAAESIGENLIKTTKTSLGIASPSKKFEEIGRNVGKGFEKGALSSMDNAFDAMENKMRQRGKILDTIARGIFGMLGMNPAAMMQQARQQRLPAAINWQATTPPRQPFTGPSSSGRALPPGPSQMMLPGTSFGRQKYLPTALGEELKKVLRDAANAFVDTLKTQIRTAKVLDLGRTMQPTLPRSTRIAGLLSPEPPGRYRAGRTEETQAELFARREREARMRSALREMDVMGGGAGRPSSPYSYVNRAARPASAMVPYAAGGALVPTMGGGGMGGNVPPRPPSGGGGMGGAGSFGRALGGINLPGTGLVREIGDEFAMATRQVLLFGTAYKALAFLTSFPAQVGQAVGALQSFNNTLKAISPTANEAKASNQFILDIVDRYNVPLQSARDGFTKLYASMAPAGFKGDEIRALFTGVSQAAATFGMSADKVDRVNYAFAQMASKGQVMSEELKGQLGDVLPGAMGIFAEAAGFTGPDAIQKFSKALEDGAYKGEAMRGLLKNVTVVLTKEFGPGAEGAARTFQGLINRMQNSTRLLYEAFEPVAVGFLNSVVVPLTSGIKTITDGFNAFFTGTQAKTAGGMAFAQELERLKPTFEGLRANITALIPSFQLFGSLLLNVAKFLATVAGNPITGFLLKVYANVLLVNTAFTLLGGRILVGLIANIGLATSRFLAMNAAIFALQRTSAVTNSTLAGTQLQMMLLQRNATGAIGPVNALLGSLLRMAAIGVVAIAITIAVNGANELRDAELRLARLRGERDPVGPEGPRPVMTPARRFTGASRETVQKARETQAPLVVQYRKELQVLQKQLLTAKAIASSSEDNAQASLANVRLKAAQARVDAKLLDIQNAQGILSLNPSQFKTAAEQQRLSMPPIIPVETSNAGKPPKEQSLESYYSLQDQLAKAQTQADIDRLEAAFEHARAMVNAEYDLKEAKANSFQKKAIAFQKEIFAITSEQDAALFKNRNKVLAAAGSVAGGAGPVIGGVVATTGGAVNQDPLTRGRSTGAHLHAQAAGVTEKTLRYLVDKYLEIGGKTASAFGQSRGSAGHGYNAIDFLTPQNTPIKLKSGASMSQYGPAGGRGGLMSQVTTPEGSFQLGHLSSLTLGGRGAAPGKVTGDVKRDKLAEQQVALMAREVNAANIEKEAEATAKLQIATANYVQSLVPTAEQTLQNQLLQQRITLTQNSFSPEILEAQLAFAGQELQVTENIKKNTEEINRLTAAGGNNAKQINALTDANNQLKANLPVSAIQLYTQAVNDQVLSLVQRAQVVGQDAANQEKINDLIIGGMTRQAAEAKVTADNLRDNYKRALEEATRQVEIAAAAEEVLAAARRLGGKETEAQTAQYNALAQALKDAKKAKDDLEGKAPAVAAAATGIETSVAPKTTKGYLAEGLSEAQENLDKLTNTGYQVVQGANAIGDAFGTAFKNIASGSMTAQQALATMFQSIADYFLDMAAQMIAAWIKMAILNTVVKIFSSAAGSAAGGGLSSGFDAGSASALPTDAGGWATSFATPLKFAEGGFVAGPTMGLIGEGGESEYVIPASKMQSAMARYSRGARGESVIAGSGGGSEGGTATAAAGPMVVDVRYNVERINEVEYVTASQFQAGMRQAAQQGAAQGEQRTLRRLQQSPGTRKRVGM